MADPIAALDCTIRLKVLGLKGLRAHGTTFNPREFRQIERELWLDICAMKRTKRDLLALRDAVYMLREIAA